MRGVAIYDRYLCIDSMTRLRRGVYAAHAEGLTMTIIFITKYFQRTQEVTQ